jgi:hypothetical protein
MVTAGAMLAAWAILTGQFRRNPPEPAQPDLELELEPEPKPVARKPVERASAPSRATRAKPVRKKSAPRKPRSPS